ncbi:uncharacterized protein PFL1_01343 [Pseudozyma flocculosa PF-1]|uniref:uncharacterized protein n=1 Tax=Pseudozyma flocculosa PF-1 TaxID=1277687 RepID=UPI0004560357|nr:uncharacterized protein PFL1_01343 [Pseudozyma flocculosa PF-1]EPQ31154.1 hypothetical protein PFL1_01343 [Pseudozyma flocculosa PF-1]
MSISDLYNIKSSIARSRETSLLSLPDPTSSTGITSRLCNICYANRAAYTCPSCNAPYCSLACFRSEAHRECSTRFSVATLRSELAPEEVIADDAERTKTMDILRRLQDPTLPVDESDDDDDGQDDGEQDASFGGREVSTDELDAMSPDQLLALLSPDERQKFELSLSDPQRAQQLMDELERKAARLALPAGSISPSVSLPEMTPSSLVQQRSVKSDEFEPPVASIWQQQAWWETSDLSPVPPKLLGDPDPFRLFATAIRKILTASPASSALSTPERAPDLSYNLLAVLTAYAYILRHLNQTSLSSLLPQPTSLESSKASAAQWSDVVPSRDPAALNRAGKEKEDDDMPPLEPDIPPCTASPTPLRQSASRDNTARMPLAACTSASKETAPPRNDGSWQRVQTGLEAFQLLDQLTPFLTALPASPVRSPISKQSFAKDSSGMPSDLSRLVLESANDASLFLLARLQEDQAGDNAAKLLLHLLRDVELLLQTEKVVAEPDGAPRYHVASTIQPESARFSASQHALALNAIWDIFHFLERLPSSLTVHMPQDGIDPQVPAAALQKRAKVAGQKLAYYASKAFLTPQDRSVHSGACAAKLLASAQLEMQRLASELRDQDDAARHAAMAKVLVRDHDAVSILPTS